MAPTESILRPPVLLGVLRVLARNEGKPPASQRIFDELEVVEQETRTDVKLARSVDRNIIRNSGQYWKGTGLLRPERGNIALTPLGRSLAVGSLSLTTFTAFMVDQTVLPNPVTYPADEFNKWKAANLEIRPFVIILDVIKILGRLRGTDAAYLTPWELVKVVIPLAGDRRSHDEMARSVGEYRDDKLNVDDWPDCAPLENDFRLAREFLLFLANFGALRQVAEGNNANERYYVDELTELEDLGLHKQVLFGDDDQQTDAIHGFENSTLPRFVERQRTTTTLLKRPGQAAFRREILEAFGHKCFLTGENVPDVLEAAHIVPVKYGGTDDRGNGLCLRVDIHRMFDSGNIGVGADGRLRRTQIATQSQTYGALPEQVRIPQFLSTENLVWRLTYL